MGNICSNNNELEKPFKISRKRCIRSGHLINKPQLHCPSHDPCCNECEAESFEKEFCIVCSRTLSVKEMSDFKPVLSKVCDRCNNEKTSTKEINCDCFLCDECVDFFVRYNNGKCSQCKNHEGFITKNLENMKKTPLPEPIAECQICYSYFQRSQMRTLDCDHYFCEECLKCHISPLLKDRKVITSGINCPLCPEKISHYIIQDLVTESEFELYQLLLVHLIEGIIECPNPNGCGFSFQTNEKYIRCRLCGYFFCISCKKEKIKCDCDENLKPAWEILEENGISFSTCPGCKTPYIKDIGCEHVECTNEKCRVSFCFQCSAFRDPTLYHGGHYHRPNCKFYAEYYGIDDKYNEKCFRCKEKGSLCNKPKILKTPRRFEPGEE